MAAVASRAEDGIVRVGDYIDDKLQTLADLETLDELLATIGNQHGLLKRQLEAAEKDLQEAKRVSQEHSSTVRKQVQQFQKEQNDIDRRLQIITRSETSDDAVRRFESSMDRLRRLDVTSGYMEMLKEVDGLSNECVSQLSISEGAALAAFHRLQNLATALGPLQEAAEGAAPHLLDHVTKTTQDVKKRIKAAFSAQLESVLAQIKWPKPDAIILAELQQDWREGVGKLLSFQKPELQAMEDACTEGQSARAPITLLPFEVLVRPLEQRFRYHFEGDRPTNRLDKPEYFLSHVTDLLNTYNGFMVDNLQPLLLKHFRGTDLALNPIYIDATSAFITALLPMLRAKIFSMLPRVSNQPQLLSHLIHEVMAFDTTIRDEWRYDGGYGVEGWKGLAWEVLVPKDWFGRWLQVEKDFALLRYQNIIDAPDAGELDFDSVDPGTTKPSKAAIRVKDLLETITDRYRPLTSFSQKIHFLIDIQIAILDRFHERLHSSLEAYLTMTSSIGRTVQGISREEQASLQGVAGLDRLCRVYGSADYLEKAMRDWSDDVFFLDLYTELQDRVSARTSKTITGPLSLSDVASRTSNTVGTDDGDADTGALFDETSAAYNRLRVRSETIVVDVLQHNTREALRAYRGINPWASLTAAGAAVAPTAELDPLLSYLGASLAFLSKALARAPLRRIVRQVCLLVDAILFDQVLLRHSFSTAGAAQMSADVGAIVAVVERWAGKGVATSGLKRVREAVQLLSLPVKSTGKSVVGETMETQAGESQQGQGRQEDRREGAGLGLWEVERRVFADNESARAVLEELGMEALLEAEARSVLERRVELGS